MEICNILFNFTRNNFFHMAKVLGLDLGTNSLGWALADEYEQGYALLDKGVEIFQEGVARDKNNENRPFRIGRMPVHYAVTISGDGFAKSTCSGYSFVMTSVHH